MRTADPSSRWPASLAVSVAAHAALLALLAGGAMVRLDVVPTRIDLAFLQVSDRSAGPGENAPELRAAAPATPAAPAAPAIAVSPPVPAPAAPREQAEVEPSAADPRPIARLEPRPAPKPSPKTKDRPVATSPATPPAEPSASTAASGAARGTATENGTSATGTDARSSAPAWAPTARVQYEQVLFAWIQRHTKYPTLARSRGLEGIGWVRVRIDRAGRVIERSIARSTGERMLDQAALETVRRANPFPALPPGYDGETFEFDAPIRYHLR